MHSTIDYRNSFPGPSDKLNIFPEGKTIELIKASSIDARHLLLLKAFLKKGSDGKRGETVATNGRNWDSGDKGERHKNAIFLNKLQELKTSEVNYRLT